MDGSDGEGSVVDGGNGHDSVVDGSDGEVVRADTESHIVSNIVGGVDTSLVSVAVGPGDSSVSVASLLLGAVDVLVAVGKVALLVLGLVLRAVRGNGSNGSSLGDHWGGHSLGDHWGSSVGHSRLGGGDDGSVGGGIEGGDLGSVGKVGWGGVG